MAVIFHHHALERMQERGATQEEVIATIEHGEQYPAKMGRMGFRRNFTFNNVWRGEQYETKQIEAYAVAENNDWIIVTVITRYF